MRTEANSTSQQLSLDLNSVVRDSSLPLQTTTESEDLRIEAAKRKILNIDPESKVFLSFSGGKDSTAVLLLLIELIIEERLDPARVFVTHSDTTIENPALAESTAAVLEYVNSNYGIDYEIASADPSRRFFATLFGYGRPVPNHAVRWCTDELKIQPMKVIKKARSEGEKIVSITGEHKGESIKRDKKLSEAKSCGSSECGVAEQAKVFNSVCRPIEDWSNCQVWDYLYSTDSKELLWSGAVFELKDIYDSTGSLGSLRTGCIGCPVISRSSHINRKSYACYELNLALFDLLDSMRDDRFRVKNPQVSRLHPELKSHRSKLKKKHLSYEDLTEFFSDKQDAVGVRNAEKGFYYYGALHVKVRRHFWNKLQPLLEQFEDSGIILVSPAERKYIEDSLAQGRYPKTYKPDMVRFLEDHWEKNNHDLELA